MKKSMIIIGILAVALLAGNTFYTLGHNLSDMLITAKKELTGSGRSATREFAVGDFDQVEVYGNIKAVIAADSPQGVVIKADDNLIDAVRVEVRKGVLTITTKGKNFGKSSTIEACIPDNGRIRTLKAGGATSLRHETAIRTEHAKIEADGASYIAAKIVADTCEAEITGASKSNLDIEVAACDIETSGASGITLKGKAGQAEFESTGASGISAAELKVAGRCSVETSGASSCTVDCDGRLEARASGCSTIRYQGECSVLAYTSGVSSITNL